VKPTPKKIVLGLIVIAILFFGWRFAREVQANREVNRVRELRDQLTGEKGKSLSREERRKGWKKLRQEMAALTPKQREALFADRRKQMRDRLAAFFKMSPEEKMAQLDKDIERGEEMRKRMESGDFAGGKRGKSGQSQSGPGGGPGAGFGAPGERQKLTPEQRENRRKQFLDSTTPEERAQRSEYFKLLSQRRKELGLPAFGFPGGGRRP
jgi:hypothetical protein